MTEIEILPETVLVHVETILESDLGEEKVMMCLNRGNYFGLSKVGGRIYDLCDGARTVQEICQRLVTQYDIDEARCSAEVADFARAMCHNGLVKIASQKAGE